jgi:hypothetical protein
MRDFTVFINNRHFSISVSIGITGVVAVVADVRHILTL